MILGKGTSPGKEVTMSFLAEAKTLYSDMKTLKDDLHRHPESSFQEVRTTARLKELLAPLGVEFIDLGMETGVVGLLRGGKPGRTVALRADIDALEQQEPGGGAVVSEIPNRMHGCGHDFHTAALYGAAALLSAHRAELAGNVVFLFQPAEEFTQGAAAMIRHGLWEKLPCKPDCLFGLHNRPEVPCGQIALLPGPIMAGKSNYIVVFHGRTGHGGSPHKCIDVLVPAAAFIQGVQSVVSRNADPLEGLVCAVCSIHGGSPENFAPDEVTITGSIRALSEEVKAMAERRVEELARQIAAAYGCTADFTLIPEVPVTWNGPEMTALARRAAEAVVGPENIVQPKPAMGSEDFAVFGRDVPAFFYWLGSGYPGREMPCWHSSQFTTDDDALPIAAALLAQSALEGLE